MYTEPDTTSTKIKYKDAGEKVAVLGLDARWARVKKAGYPSGVWMTTSSLGSFNATDKC